MGSSATASMAYNVTMTPLTLVSHIGGADPCNASNCAGSGIADQPLATDVHSSSRLVRQRRLAAERNRVRDRCLVGRIHLFCFLSDTVAFVDFAIGDAPRAGITGAKVCPFA